MPCSLANLPLPWIITQQSSLVLCFATSAPVSLTACVSLLLWFILPVSLRYRCKYMDIKCFANTK